MDKRFHPPIYWIYDFLSLPGLNPSILVEDASGSEWTGTPTKMHQITFVNSTPYGAESCHWKGESSLVSRKSFLKLSHNISAALQLPYWNNNWTTWYIILIFFISSNKLNYVSIKGTPCHLSEGLQPGNHKRYLVDTNVFILKWSYIVAQCRLIECPGETLPSFCFLPNFYVHICKIQQ